MFFKNIFITLLTVLYFDLTVCFYNTIMSKNILFNKQISLYNINSHILLPNLTPRDKIIISLGERLQKQEINGTHGSGLVVLDIKCSPDLVFDTLTKFSMYQDMIPIVKTSKILNSDNDNTLVKFTLSKFLLNVNINHKILKEERLIKFSLSRNKLNMIFKEVEGFWYVQIPTDRPEGYCRVYFITKILIHKTIPTFLIDNLTKKSLQKATQWLTIYFN